MRSIQSLLKCCAHVAFGNYTWYRIYQSPEFERGGLPSTPVDSQEIIFRQLWNVAELAASPHECLRGLVPYGGEGAFGFGAWHRGVLVSACWCWVGPRYETRGFWPLQPGEAKLVQIVTAEEHRNQRIAQRLLQFVVREMHHCGYRRLFARIWHSHRVSIATFELAGWIQIASIFELSPLGVGKRRRIVYRVRNTRSLQGPWTDPREPRTSVEVPAH